jgi:hypothetical protein
MNDFFWHFDTQTTMPTDNVVQNKYQEFTTRIVGDACNRLARFFYLSVYGVQIHDTVHLYGFPLHRRSQQAIY